MNVIEDTIDATPDSNGHSNACIVRRQCITEHGHS